jgi:hypothetical protein
MSELFHEIQDDVRAERMNRLWTMFGKYIVGGSIGIVVITIIVVTAQHFAQKAHMAATSEYINALDAYAAKNYAGAAKSLDKLIERNHAAFRDMAIVKKAEVLNAQNKKDEAKKTLSLTTDDDTAHAALARLEQADTADITPEKSSPFYYSENEWQAWKLLQSGKTDEALAIFTKLKDAEDAPASLRKRAADAALHITVKKQKG